MTASVSRIALALLIATAACARRDNLTNLHPGTEVDVIRHNGGVVHGTLTRVSGKDAVVAVGARERTIPVDDVADVRTYDSRNANQPRPLPAIAKFREQLVPDGTTFTIRLETPLASNASRVEDPVEARLARPIVVDGTEVLPAGVLVKGAVSEVRPSGRVKDRAILAIHFASVADANGAVAPITGRLFIQAPSTKRNDAEKIGIGAAGGSVIGAIVSGKKGAAIGAAVGGGAGTAVVLATPGKDITWPRGTLLSFTLDRDAVVRMPIGRS